MIGLLVSLFYAFILFMIGSSWPEIYLGSTTLLFKWYFISSLLMIFLLAALVVIVSSAFEFLAFAYKTAETVMGCVGVVVNSVRSLLELLLKRIMLICGAYLLHFALVFDETKVPPYSWDGEKLIWGVSLLLAAYLSLTHKPRLRFKLINNSSRREIIGETKTWDKKENTDESKTSAH